MKNYKIKSLWGMALGLVLLAAVSIAVQAQSEVKPAQINAPSAQKAEAKEAAENKEITLVLEGKIYGGMFVFEGKTIQFNNMMSYRQPEDITVNGTPWKDITKPFELDYTPDFAKAGLLEQVGNRTYYVDAAEKRFSLMITNHSPRNRLEPFHVKLAMKDQLPHGDIPGYQPAPEKKDPPKVMTAGPDPYVIQANAQWDNGTKERKIEIKAIIRGRGAFVFEGNTITYRKEEGQYPDSVKINGRRWTRMESRNFELPFQIETAHPEMVKNEGENPVKLTKISDRKFEVFFDDSEPASRRHSPVYTVTITPEKQPESK